MKLFYTPTGALGHGDHKSWFTPKPIQFLRDKPKITDIAVGSAFVNAINAEEEIYNWGRGEYGVFGDGRNKSLSLPEKNYYFTLLKENDKLTLK